jgi:hypothetical protein
MRKLALALVLACATGGLFVIWTAGTAIGAGPHGPDARRVAAERIEVPIKQSVLTGGGIRYSVPVRIGNASPIDAFLDTGSTGLRVLGASVPELAYSVSKQTSIYGYGSGDRAVGVIARAVVTIGQAATDEPIPIEVVKSVDCSTTARQWMAPGAIHPMQHTEGDQCPASRVSAADYRFGGNGLARQGFGATLGINMVNSDAVNPLLHIGAHSWIVILPRPGEAQPGTLIVNPNSGDRTGYILFPTDKILRSYPGAWHDAIAGCLASADPPNRICGPTLLDTGTVGIHISSANAADLSGWKACLGMQIALKNKSDAELSTKFAADSGLPSRISTTLMPNQPRTGILAGVLPYFDFSALRCAAQCHRLEATGVIRAASKRGGDLAQPDRRNART